MTVELRDYAAHDRPQLIELVRELQHFEGTLFERMKPSAQIGDWYIDNMLADCARFAGSIFVAAQDGRLLGYATILTALTSKHEPDEIFYTYANITDLVVTEAWRGTGLGRRLLEECERVARTARVKWLRISVLASNDRAVQTYEKFGFAPLHLRMEKHLA